jgi:Protein of unknown function (DUF5131)
MFLNFPIADRNRNVLCRNPEAKGIRDSDIQRMNAFWPDDEESWRKIAYTTDRDLFGFPEKEENEAIKFLSLEPLLGPLPDLDLTGIDWAIVGGASGPKARPMDPAWVREIRDQCRAAEVAFFFKQWGGTRKSWTGRELDGRTWNEYPHHSGAILA